MDKLESMVLEAETVSALMIHLADDDVGDTSFAVMSDLGENGTEHECDLGVHETALRASAVIDALLAELEASKTNAEYYKSAFEEQRDHADMLEKRLATPVRLPAKLQWSYDDSTTKGEVYSFNNAIDACDIAICKAGFKCVGDE